MPELVAWIATLVSAETACVVAANVAAVAPSGILTSAGTLSTAGFALCKVTTVPPAGAALLNATEPLSHEPRGAFSGNVTLVSTVTGVNVLRRTATRIAL
jgi:hypothetical protein